MRITQRAMYTKRPHGGYGLFLVGLLVLSLTVSFTGCNESISGPAIPSSASPFYKDRVVTVRILMSEDDWESTRRNARAEEYVKADLWFDGQLVSDVAVRPKGNSSLTSVAQSGSSRMSLKTDLNFFNDARNLNGVKKLNFNNGFSDPTLIREALSYDLFAQMGVPTPDFSFVDLWVNDTHLGVYTMVEQIDKTFLSDRFANSNGNLYKPESPGGHLSWTAEDLSSQSQKTDNAGETNDPNIGGGKLSEIEKALGIENSASATPAPAVPNAGGIRPGGQGGLPGMGRQKGYLESMGLKTNENNSNHQALLHFLDVLNNEPEETFQKEIEKVLDVDEVLRYLAVSTALVHLDNYIGQFAHNYYLYEVDGKFTIIPWDLNMSFGGFGMGMDRRRIIDFYIDEPTSGRTADRPLVSRLLAVPAYLETYHVYLAELISGPFSPEVMNAKVDSLADLIRPYVEADTLKFYSTREFEKGLGEDIGTSTRTTGMGINIGLKAFVTQRGGSIKNQLEGTLPGRSTDGTGNGGILGPGGFPANQGNQRPVFPPNQVPQRQVFPNMPPANQVAPNADTGGQ